MSTSTDLRDELPALLTIHDIAALFRVRRTTAYARTRDPDFPDPLVMSDSCYRWYAHEVLAYVDARRTPKRAFTHRVSPATGGSLPPVTAEATPRPRPRRRQPPKPGAAPSDTQIPDHPEP